MTTSGRISKTELHRLGARLSDRDWRIIWLLRQHPYLTTLQFRSLLFNDHASLSAGTRACTRVLSRLLVLRIITRLERRIGDYRHGSASYVWCLDAVGERLTRSEGGARGRFHEPSLQFLHHCLAVADAHVSLVAAERDGHFLIDQLAIEKDAWRSYVASHGSTAVLKPDLQVSLATASYTDHWYMEIDRGTESLGVVLRKCRAYEAYRRTGRAQAEHGAFPRVLWVMPTTVRIERLKAALAADGGLPDRLFAYSELNFIPVLLEPP